MRASTFLRTYARLISLVVVAAVVAVTVFGVHEYQSRNGKVIKPSVAACDILTASVAKAVGGQDVTYQKLKDSNTDTNKTTYCAYRSATKTISLAVRSAKNEQGVDLNKTAFSSPVVSSQRVNGYGDSAFWTPGFAQLNILRHGTWYILSNGPSKPSERTLDQSKTFANTIIDKL